MVIMHPDIESTAQTHRSDLRCGQGFHGVEEPGCSSGPTLGGPGGAWVTVTKEGGKVVYLEAGFRSRQEQRLCISVVSWSAASQGQSPKPRPREG